MGTRSKLYTGAVAELDAAPQAALREFERKLARSRVASKGSPVDGKQLVANLRREAHLTGTGSFGDPEALRGFLVACALAATGPKRRRAIERHDAACEVHALRGLRIGRKHLPRRLLRYSTSKTSAAKAIAEVLGLAARQDFDEGKLSPGEAFDRIRDAWSGGSSAMGMLAVGRVVWATFRRKKGTPRRDAKGMAQALALPAQGPGTLLFELAYPRKKVRGFRFPTVADAGMFDLFRPAAERAPELADRRTLCGWTRPVGPWPRQPEVVHENSSLEVLAEPPRFVGRIA